MNSPHTSRQAASPEPLWELARLALEHGWCIDIAPRGSGIRLKMWRSARELVVSWKASDRFIAGDARGGWTCNHTASRYADVRATITLLGRPFFPDQEAQR